METRKISLPYYIRQKPCEPAKGKAKAQQKASCSFLQPFIRQMHQVICHIRLIGAISGWHIFSLWLPVQQMAFHPSRLICKIKNFFDVFFFTFFVGAGRAENTQENTNACGHSGKVSAGIKNRLLSVRASRSFPDIKSCHHLLFFKFFQSSFFLFFFPIIYPSMNADSRI